jgi:hypothetical protein
MCKYLFFLKINLRPRKSSTIIYSRLQNELPDFSGPDRRSGAETIEIWAGSDPVSAPMSASDSPPDPSSLIFEVLTGCQIKDGFRS